MKIALLGTAQSGKTVYFSALYHRFANVIYAPKLTERQREKYKDNGINTQVSFSLTVDNMALDDELAAKARLLSSRPIKWPETTDHLEGAKLNIHLGFIPLNGIKARVYKRDIELFDPPGGAFSGEHRDSHEIIDQLCNCNSSIVFFPADIILDAVDIDNPEDIHEDLLADIRGKFSFGRIIKTMMGMNDALDINDVFSICFVLTKMDLIPESKLELVNEIIYNFIIVPFSEQNEKLIVYVCPISVISPKTGNFRSSNLEWPFLLAAQGAIIREAKFWQERSQYWDKEANHTSAKATLLRRSGVFTQIMHFITEWGETHEDLQEEANSKYANSRQAHRWSNEEKTLANDILASITAEKQLRSIHILQAGVQVGDECNPINIGI